MKRKIHAVHDRDLKEFLKDLNVLDRILNGEIRCPECDCTVTLENLGFITMHRKDIRIFCDNIECFYRIRTRTTGEEQNEA
jgi:hypothetical protein